MWLFSNLYGQPQDIEPKVHGSISCKVRPRSYLWRQAIAIMHYSSSITFSVDRNILVSRAYDQDDNSEGHTIKLASIIQTKYDMYIAECPVVGTSIRESHPSEIKIKNRNQLTKKVV